MKILEPRGQLRSLAGIVVAFDLEWTAWEGSKTRNWSHPGEAREVVEIGAVRLDADRGLTETGSLALLVRPRLNPMLSEYFVNLTGITQERLERNAVPYPEALSRFAAFAHGATMLISGGDDPSVLHANCEITGIALPLDEALFVDAMPAFGAALGQTRFSTSDLPRLMGFDPPGRAHSALADARCLAEGLRQLSRAARTPGSIE